MFWMILFTVSGALALLMYGGSAIPFFLNVNKIGLLKNESENENDGTVPSERITVVVAARNEQKAIVRCAESLLAQTYPQLEVVVVDDRSHDDTPRLLEELERRHDRLRVLNVRELPAGWLGKSHALALGAAQTEGEWLLFTDADILFDPRAISEALGYVRRNRLDHLTLIPEFGGPKFVCKPYAAFIFQSAVGFGQLWKMKDPAAKQTLGVGAFNLIRREAYVGIGTHEAFKMHTTDDNELARQVQQKPISTRMRANGKRNAKNRRSGLRRFFLCADLSRELTAARRESGRILPKTLDPFDRNGHVPGCRCPRRRSARRL